MKFEITTITARNIDEYPAPCFMNASDGGYLGKKKWLKARFKEGLVIKQIYADKNSRDKKKANAFIEYIPGEFANRAVDAKDYLFIHRLWVSPNKFKQKGLAKALINDCIADAKKQKLKGVAVVTSEGSFMAGKDVFAKHGFKSVDETKPSFNLMVYLLKKAAQPIFKDVDKKLAKCKGFQLFYSKQCPWVERSIAELKAISEKQGLSLKVTELKTAKQIQNGPSIYGVFSLINDSKLLADHYISATRFKNIVKKEVLI